LPVLVSAAYIEWDGDSAAAILPFVSSQTTFSNTHAYAHALSLKAFLNISSQKIFFKVLSV